MAIFWVTALRSLVGAFSYILSLLNVPPPPISSLASHNAHLIPHWSRQDFAFTDSFLYLNPIPCTRLTHSLDYGGKYSAMSNRLYGATTQKTAIFILAAMRTSHSANSIQLHTARVHYKYASLEQFYLTVICRDDSSRSTRTEQHICRHIGNPSHHWFI